MTNSTTVDVSPAKLQRIAESPKFKALAAAVKFTTAEAIETRAKVDAYASPLFQSLGFVDDENTPLTNPEDAYLSDQDDLFDKYITAVHEAHIANGFEMVGLEVGVCPALVAEHYQINAEHNLIAYMREQTGMPDWTTLEQRSKMLEVYMTMAQKAAAGQ